MKQKIIDVHMHPIFEVKSLIRSANDAKINFNLEELLKEFKKNNIVKAVGISLETHKFENEEINSSFCNESIKKLVSENKEKFLGACAINPLEFTDNEIARVEDDIKKGFFSAVKLFPGYVFFYPDQKECYPIYEMAQRNKVPVLFHTGDTWTTGSRLKYAHPLNIDDVAVSFPNVKFVMCHLGNPWILDAVEVMYKNENVYADLSGFVVEKENVNYKQYCKGRLRATTEGINYEDLIINKLMFGTDYPLVSYDFYINFIRKLKLDKEDNNKIFFDNAAKLFNIKV